MAEQAPRGSREWLAERYEVRKWSIREIARALGWSYGTARSALVRNGIVLRDRGGPHAASRSGRRPA